MKLAFLKKISFDPFPDKYKNDPQYLFQNDNYKNYLENKLEFHDFNGTLNLFKKIKELMSSSAIEIFNCTYDNKFLIQAFYYHTESDGYDEIIFVKRQLLEKDSYTYLDFVEDDDKHIYHDVELIDLIQILKNKYVIKGLIVKASTNTLEEIEFIKTPDFENIGEIIIYQHDTIKYLNIKNIINKIHNDDSITNPDDSINTIVNEIIDSHSLNYVYTQKNMDFCVLNYYSQIIGFEKNIIMSEILRDNIYGDIIISIENVNDDDTRILNLTTPLFNNIYKCIQSKIFKRKNHHYFNIYYEFFF
jgi:hypothetical protein